MLKAQPDDTINQHPTHQVSRACASNIVGSRDLVCGATRLEAYAEAESHELPSEG